VTGLLEPLELFGAVSYQYQLREREEREKNNEQNPSYFQIVGGFSQW